MVGNEQFFTCEGLTNTSTSPLSAGSVDPELTSPCKYIPECHDFVLNSFEPSFYFNIFFLTHLNLQLSLEVILLYALLQPKRGDTFHVFV